MNKCLTCALEDPPQLFEHTCSFCDEMSRGFATASAKRQFYAATALWLEESNKPVCCTVFYREAYCSGYAYALYQRHRAMFVAFEQSLDQVFQKLHSIGCGYTTWRPLSRSNACYYMTHLDCRNLWQVRAYGVLREIGTFDLSQTSQ